MKNRLFYILIVLIALASTAHASEPVPGLTVAKMQKNLSQLGFSCKGPKADGSWKVWNCEKGGRQSHSVDLTGDASGNLVAASVYTFGKDLSSALSLAGSISAISYEGSDAARVKRWLETSTKSNKLGAKLEIDGVVFYMSTPNPLNLDISVKGF